MHPPGPTRAIAAVGVIGFVVPALGSVMWAPTWRFPGTRASGTEITTFVMEHRWPLLLGVLLDALGVTLWGMFGAGIWLRLREASGGDTFLTSCFLLGVVSFVPLLLAGFLAFLVLTYRGAAIADPRVLYDTAFGLLAMSGLPTALALGAYALVTFRIRHLPLWTAALGAVGAVAHLLLMVSFLVEEGFFSLEGQVITVIPATLFFWVVGTAVALLRAGPLVPTRQHPETS